MSLGLTWVYVRETGRHHHKMSASEKKNSVSVRTGEYHFTRNIDQFDIFLEFDHYCTKLSGGVIKCYFFMKWQQLSWPTLFSEAQLSIDASVKACLLYVRPAIAGDLSRADPDYF